MADNTLIRGSTAAFGKFAENITADVRMSQHRSLFVQQLEPKYMEFARTRNLYGANTGAGTAKAPKAAIPTTNATWVIYNGYPESSGIHLVILKAYSWLVSGTKGLGGAFLGCVTTTPQAAAVSAYASSVSAAMHPRPVNSTSAVFGNNVTLAAAPVWNILETRDTLATDAIGPAFVANDLDGLYLVAPGCCFGMDILDEAGTAPLFGCGAIWGELRLDIG